jgi:hypothetical protein
MKRKLETAADSSEFIQLSRLGLSYGYGLPGKVQDATPKRQSLVFVTTNGLLPWDERADSMKEITDRMLEQKAQEEKVQLEAARKPETVDVTDKGDTEIPETLEVVEPPPQPPQDFNPGRGGR